MAYCKQNHNDPDLCPEAAAAFASLIEEYRELANQLESEDWGEELTQEVSDHFDKLPQDASSQGYMSTQPALGARLVMAGWNPRDKTRETNNNYAAYYIYMISRVRLEVPEFLHWKGRNRLYKTLGNQSTGDATPPWRRSTGPEGPRSPLGRPPPPSSFGRWGGQPGKGRGNPKPPWRIGRGVGEAPGHARGSSRSRRS